MAMNLFWKKMQAGVWLLAQQCWWLIKDMATCLPGVCLMGVFSQIPLPPFPTTLTCTIAAGLWIGLTKSPYKGLLTVLMWIIFGVYGLPLFPGLQGGLFPILGLRGGWILGLLITVPLIAKLSSWRFSQGFLDGAKGSYGKTACKYIALGLLFHGLLWCIGMGFLTCVLGDWPMDSLLGALWESRYLVMWDCVMSIILGYLLARRFIVRQNKCFGQRHQP